MKIVTTKFNSKFQFYFEQTRYRAHMAQKKLQQAKVAATKIQAQYKGYRTRKMLLVQKEMENSKDQPLLLVSDIVHDMVNSSMVDNKVCVKG